MSMTEYQQSLVTNPLLPSPQPEHPEYKDTKHLDPVTIATLTQLGLPQDAHGAAIALLTMPTLITTAQLVLLCKAVIRPLDPAIDPLECLRKIEVINCALDSHKYSRTKPAPAGLAGIAIDCAIIRSLALRADPSAQFA